MSGTVTTTTKVFPTDTPDVTPASDDRIMFSDTSDGGKTKDASIDQIFSSPGPKTFTDDNIYHDVTGNTESPKMRRAAKITKVKNVGDAGGVEFVEYVDADNSIVGFRKRALRGYLRKSSDGSYGSHESFITCEFPTYDGNTTYTKKTTIESELTVGSQDRTGAWTNRTPARNGGITTSSFTVHNATYKQIGKTAFVQGHVSITPSSSGSFITLTVPIRESTNTATSLSIRVGGLIAGQSYIQNGNITFETTFVSGTPISFMFSGSYPCV